MVKSFRILLSAIIVVFSYHNSYPGISINSEVESISFNLLQYLDLADLEYDDSPYPGRTNMGHVFIPNLRTKTKHFDLITGGWYRHVYVQFDEEDTPAKLYPYLSVVFHPWDNSGLTVGNYENLFPFPNTIYSEFLFFEERPVSSGLKFFYSGEKLKFIAYLDWTELDTEEHPEEFLTGIYLEHYILEHLYYKFYNHYHHKGGQLHKETHPVRLQQDVVTSPLIGFRFRGFFLELQYYWSIFEQNFEPAIYGHAGDALLGYSPTDKLQLSYLCWYNYNYYHGDAHLFYLKRKNVLHRLRVDYNLFNYQRIVDLYFTANLYGVDPPGIDFRIYGKIDLDLIKYKREKTDKKP
jgi:hypothetical protein